MRSYKARGIVLGSLKYGDNALVVTLLTDTLGRQSYLIPGVRSARGHGNKAAHYQPMGLVEFEGYEVPRGQMHRIREVRNLLPLSSLRFDARKSAIALFMAEVLHRLIREVEPDSPLFEFVLGAVEALDGLTPNSELRTDELHSSSSFAPRPSGASSMALGLASVPNSDGVANFHLWFLVRLCALLGFYPAGSYRAGDWLDIREGLFTPRPSDLRAAIEPREAAILAQLMDAGIDDLGALPLSGAGRTKFLDALLGYLGYHLDIRSVQSLAVLREIF